MATSTVKTYLDALVTLWAADADIGGGGSAVKKGPQVSLTKSQNVVVMPADWERPVLGLDDYYEDKPAVEAHVAVKWADTEANYDAFLDLCQACVDAVEADRSLGSAYDLVELTKCEWSKGPWILGDTQYRHAVLTFTASKEG